MSSIYSLLQYPNEEKSFGNFEVSGKNHNAINVKERTLWEILNIHFFAKYQKTDPLEAFKNSAKKVTKPK